MILRIFNEEALLKEVEVIKEKREELNNILDELRKNNNILKEHWETQTSDSVFSSFEEAYYAEFEKQIKDIDEDILFLEETINNYKNNESQTNKEIDENIAV